MKTLLVGLAGLLVAFVAALAVAPRFIDWNAYRPEIAALVERATGRALEIEGDVQLSLLPTPMLSARALKLSNIEGASVPEMMQLKSMDARIALGPLFRGQIFVESIALVEPVVYLERLRDGRRNWQFEGSDGVVGADAILGREDRVDEGFLSFDRIIVVGGTLVVVREDAVERITGINAEISAESASGPFRVNGDATLRGLPLRVEAGTGRISAREASPLNVQLSLRGGGAELRFAGTLSPGAAESIVAGRLRGEIGRLRDIATALGHAEDLPAPLGQRLAVEGNLQAGAARATLSNLSLSLGDSRATGSAALAYESTPSFDLTLAATRIDLDRWLTLTRAPNAASGSFGAPSIAAPRPPRAGIGIDGNVDLTVDAVLWRGGVVRQARLNAALSGATATIRQAGAQLPGGSDFTLFGTATVGDAPRFDGNLEGGGDNLRGVLDWLKLDVSGLPSDRLRRVSVTSRVGLDAGTLQLANLDLRFDSSRLTGGLVMALRERPGVGANLAVDQINLDAYLQRGLLPSGLDGVAAALEALDANLVLRADQLGYAGETVAGIALDATLQSGQLTIREARARDLGGVAVNLTGRANVVAGMPQVDLRLAIEAGDLSRVMRAAGLEAPANLGAVRLDATARGAADRAAVELAGDAAETRIRIAGTGNLADLPGTAELVVTAQHAELLRLLRACFPDYRPTAERIGGGSIEGRLVMKAGSIAISDFIAKLGPSSFRGTGDLDLTGPRPRLRTALTLDSLVLDPLLPSRRLAAADRPSAVGLDWLRAIDFDLTLAGGVVDWRKHNLADLALAASMADGHLSVSSLTGELFEGKFSATGSLAQGAEVTATMAFQLVGAELRRVAEEVVGRPLLSGKGDFNGRVTARGAAWQSMLATLEGGGGLYIRGGRLDGIDLAGATERLQAPNPSTAEIPGALRRAIGTGGFVFNNLSGTYRVENGIATTEDLRIAADEAELAARGTLVDLGTDLTDLRLAVRLAAFPEAPPFVVRLVGPIDNPRRDVEAGDLIDYLVRSRPSSVPVR